MGREESRPEVYGICNRLFNFLMDILMVKGLERVTLGHPSDHGSTQGLISSSPRNGASSIGDDYVDLVKNTEEKEGMHTMVHRKAKNDADLAHCATSGSSIHALKEGSATLGGGQTQVQNGLNAQLIRRRMVPVEGLEYKIDGSKSAIIDQVGEVKVGNSLSKIQEKNDQQVPQKDMVVHNATFQSEGLKKTISTKGAKKKEKREKGKSISWKENLTLVIEPEKDVNVAPRPVRPSIRVGFNIDEQSDELIRRTREALRNSSEIEPMTP